MGGIACCKHRQEFNRGAGGDLALPTLNALKKTDPIVKFELQFPFCKTHIKDFCDKINKLGKDTVDYDTLSAVFDSPAWAGQWKPGALTRTHMAKLPHCNEETANVSSLI